MRGLGAVPWWLRAAAVVAVLALGAMAVRELWIRTPDPLPLPTAPG